MCSICSRRRSLRGRISRSAIKRKREIRELALALGLSAGGRKESQDICFIRDGDYRAYLEHRAPRCMQPG